MGLHNTQTDEWMDGQTDRHTAAGRRKDDLESVCACGHTSVDSPDAADADASLQPLQAT